ncbi:MAG: hypothetical protein ACRBK7_25390 [Acidimicrobiales bacterium]
MRIGIDLLAVTDPAQRLAAAIEADDLGLWAVLIGGAAGTEAIEAAIIATKTSSIHLAVMLEGGSEHPLTLAEEISVLDHLSQRRALAIIDGEPDGVGHTAKLLAGHIVDGVALSPPPAQTVVPVWAAADVARVDLSGDIERDGRVIDDLRDNGCTHLFVTWPGPLLALARHLMTRAVGPDFPSVVAELADRIDPPVE